MKPPIDHIRVSAKGRDVLIKIKRRTGLEHWNAICRIALCRSLANPTRPAKVLKAGDSAIDMEWKTFAGEFGSEFTSAILLRATHDEVALDSREGLAEYVKAHIERGIASMQNVKSLGELIK